MFDINWCCHRWDWENKQGQWCFHTKINPSQCSRWLVNQTSVWMTQLSGTSVSKARGAAHVVKANKWIRLLVANVWLQCKTKILKINPSATSGICLRSAMTVAAPLPCQRSYYHRELWELIHQWPTRTWWFSARTSSCVGPNSARLSLLRLLSTLGSHFPQWKQVLLSLDLLFFFF